MASLDDELNAQLTRLGNVLDKRAGTVRKLDKYLDGNAPFPRAVVQAQMTNAYTTLMSMAGAPWGALVVDSVLDRLEVIGVRAEDQAAADAVWGVWQDNGMDSESKLAHDSSLVHGRSYATVWPENGGPPRITLDSAEQMVIEYAEADRRRRRAAMRGWVDEEDGRPYATLYRPDGLYKFQGPKGAEGANAAFAGFSGVKWERREVRGESWPLSNPIGLVPVVELAVNRKLKAKGRAFGHARGEFEHCLGLLDRINLLTFLGLVVAIWLGFPLRGILGGKILKDDSGNTIPPFDASPDTVFQITDAQAKIAEFQAADRDNLSVFAELTQLAYVTKTPAHYFPMAAGLSNISADAIRALEGALHAKVTGHKASLGEGWEEVQRLGGLMLESPVALPSRAELQWRDSESRSLAERADAFVKLTGNGVGGLPWAAAAELALGATQGQISRWQTMRSTDAFGQLLAAATQPAPAPATP